MSDQETRNEGVREQLISACENSEGLLMVINLDNFQIFDYIYGKELSEELLRAVSKALKDNTGDTDVRANLGADGFVVFSKTINDSVSFSRLYGNMKNKLAEYAKSLVGEDMKISLGVSVGVVMVPQEGTDFSDLFQKANSALSMVKMTGTPGCAFYGNTNNLPQGENVNDRVQTVSRGLDENGETGALWLEYEQFSIVYRFMKRYIQTYNRKAVKMLITVSPTDVTMSEEELDAITREFGMVVNQTLRKSDVMMQSRPHQYFLILNEMDDAYISKTYARIMSNWQESPNYYKIRTSYECEDLQPAEQ
ncbi:MAG: diguanylate cyclase [Eubacterium sp.]|nr:diguanylate cyclase [Eubacterium sp.]